MFLAGIVRGDNLISMKRLPPFSLLCLILFFMIGPHAAATTYYIAANGSDSNNGTSSASPWAHAPGMPNCKNVCGSTTPNAGDHFTFRGGDTWHLGNSSASSYVGGQWIWNWSGSSANPIYVGVDQTWYSGSSWSRPVLNGDNPLWTGSGFPSSCAHAESGSLVSLGTGSLSFVVFDNFEFTGVCWTGQASMNGAFLNVPGGDTNLIVSNLYIHGWTMTSGASDNFPAIQSFGGGTSADLNQFVGLVIDGADSPHFGAGSPNCQWSGNGGSGCASGQGFNGSHVYDVHQSVVRYVSNIMVTANCHTMHDNVFEYLYPTFASGSLQQHPNVMNCLGGATGDNLYWYNNIMRNTFSTENVYFAVRTNIYFFNNVMFNNMNSTVGEVPAGCIRFNNVSNSAQSTTAYVYNNTFGDSSCQLKFEVANSPLTAWSGTAYFENNHIIGFSPATLSNLYICATSGTCKINDNGNEVFQSESAANGQGYSSSNDYAPTSSTGASVLAGASVSTCSAFSTDAALCDGTSDGVAEMADNGGKIASFPSISIVSRNSSWDAGAYQFQSTSQKPNPPTGLAAAVQ